MPNKLFGRATVTVDGTQYRMDKGSKIHTGGVKRNEVVGMNVEGYSEEADAAFVEGNLIIGPETDFDAINASEDVTVLFTCDSGQQYVLAHAWLESPIEATADPAGGKAPVKFVAVKSEKL